MNLKALDFMVLYANTTVGSSNYGSTVAIFN